MWESPLRKALVACGARFAPYDDARELADAFGADVLAEYHAVRSAAGLLDLSHRRKIRVRGADRATFLHGMLTNDIKRLGAGEGCPAAFLTVQGRVVADLRVFVDVESILLDATPVAASGLVAGLERHLIADDVELEEVTAELATLAVVGPRAVEVLTMTFGRVPPLARELDHCGWSVAGPPGVLARVSEVAEPGYQLMVPPGAGVDLWARILECGRGLGLAPVGRSAFDVLRVEAGVPWYGIDMDESRLALEVGFSDSISATKGCYLGQEVIERVGARGHVNRRLTGLRVLGTAVPERGAAVLAGEKEIGTVTSAVTSPAVGGPVALAYVRREHLEPGTRVAVLAEGGPVDADVTPLPFIRR
jgi:folate-binding protein YgfZ